MQKMRRVKAKPPTKRGEGKITDMKSILRAAEGDEEDIQEPLMTPSFLSSPPSEKQDTPYVETGGEPIVFGLDIGTRSIVGTVGFSKGKKFHVLAIHSRGHETRSMLDGQIHDIKAVSETIREVKTQLERDTGLKLKDVCIAAAGRVLRTVNTHVEKDFDEPTDITAEDIYSLELQGAQQAYSQFLENNSLNMKFYCVGYTVVRYYLNHYPMSDLEDHKGENIGADLIATFLPDEVVDGLYKAVNMAGLNVANLTLEPIAAMEVAIPASFRMLNIALVDVGAGTSDISITRDGAIIAYGMIPSAGDEITEIVAKTCLCGFDEAEKIKADLADGGTVEFTDIMGLKQTMEVEKILEACTPTVRSMTREISDKIKKLNGGKSVSAVFVVGGGGKVSIFTKFLAEELGIIEERVAVRGEEVFKDIEFTGTDITVDSLLVTPIGICLNFYNMKNNFIFVDFNGTQIKLYDNSNLRVVDAAMQAGFSNLDLFPKHGQDINYTINGKKRMSRGQAGEPAVIKLNGAVVSMNEKIKAGDDIQVEPSTAGPAAVLELGKIPEFSDNIHITINGSNVEMPKFASVNGELKSAYYTVQDGDEIDMLKFYTVRQVLDFIDIHPERNTDIYVNHRLADDNTQVYDNFTVNFTVEGGDPYINDPDAAPKAETPQVDASVFVSAAAETVEKPKEDEEAGEASDSGSEAAGEAGSIKIDNSIFMSSAGTAAVETAGDGEADDDDDDAAADEDSAEPEEDEDEAETEGRVGEIVEEVISEEDKELMLEATGKVTKLEDRPNSEITVTANGENVVLTGKPDYVFVDIFDHIDFDRSTPHGSMVVLKRNGHEAEYTELLENGDELNVYWA